MTQVLLERAAAEELSKLRHPLFARINRILERLEDWPDVSGVKPLSGNLAGHYRVRTGDYRVQFFLEDGSVVVEKIGHRDGFYED